MSALAVLFRKLRPFAALLLAGLLATACAGGPEAVAEGGASRMAVGYVTDIRQSNGLASLVPDSVLERAALEQARYMARSDRMTHSTGWGRGFSTRMKKNGINGVAAENLAHGRMEPAKVFSMWMNSPGHRRNMLEPRIKRFGLAYATDGKSDRRYWALVVAD